ncbi:hypothetical protein cypCar_00034461, partial [Cyprinus carpio]
VVMKIIKHYQEEGQGSEVVQGVLLGLVVEDRLEITNCFPFPHHTEDDADFEEAISKRHSGIGRHPTALQHKTTCTTPAQDLHIPASLPQDRLKTRHAGQLLQQIEFAITKRISATNCQKSVLQKLICIAVVLIGGIST